MCRRIFERYTICQCLYYAHGIDACASKNIKGHIVEEDFVLVGIACPEHLIARESWHDITVLNHGQTPLWGLRKPASTLSEAADSLLGQKGTSEKSALRQPDFLEPGPEAHEVQERGEQLPRYKLVSIETRQPVESTEAEYQNVIPASLSQDPQFTVINTPEYSNINEGSSDLGLSIASQVQTTTVADIDKETCRLQQAEIVFGCESGIRGCQALEKLRLNPRRPLDAKCGPQFPEKLKKEPDKARQIVSKMLRDWEKTCPDSSSDFGLSFEAMVEKYRRFREKATEAFRKLQRASVFKSEELQNFVFSDLRTIDNIINIGHSTLCDFVDRQKQKPPDNLVNLYCMLHVCYAMSQTTDAESPKVTNDQFAMAASEWKDCLTAEKDPEIRRQKQYLFDEIKEIMWDEFKEGLEYAMLFRERVCVEPNPILHNCGDFDSNDSIIDSQHLFDPICPVDMGVEELELDWDSFLCVDFLDSDTDFNPMMHEPLNFIGGLGDTTSLDKAKLKPPAGERLVGNIFVTTAFTFIRELQETGIVFMYICGSLAVSTLRRFLDVSASPVRQPPDLHLQERQNIINSLQKSLRYERHPESYNIIDAVSGPFLAGIIDTFQDLEECMVVFMSITIFDPQSLVCFFTLLTTHFYSYYHQSLPQRLKCAAEVYDSPIYVLERIGAGEKILAISTDIVVDTVSTLDTSQDAAALPNFASPDTKTSKRKAVHDDNEMLAMKASMKKFRCNNSPPKPSNASKQLIFKNIMGEPRKRRNKPRSAVGVKS